MLPRSKRVSTKHFNTIMQKGEIYHSPHFILRRIRNTPKCEFAISVPKKVAKSAVERNRIKRTTYSAIKELDVVEKDGSRVAIIVKIGAEKLSFQGLKGEISQIFVKSGILK